jgi:putative membrane protein
LDTSGTIDDVAVTAEEPMHIIGLVIIILLIAAAVWFVHDTNSGRTDGGWPRIERGSSRSHALQLLEERYARGEISREEYLQKRRDLEK